MSTPLVQQALFLKRLPRLYSGALLLIAAFVLSGQILIQVLLSQQTNDGHVISLAANQETLSQRVSKDALAIALTTDPQQRTYYLDQFTNVALTWNRVHLGLQHGDSSLQLPPNNDPEIAQRFKALEPQYQGILHAALNVLGVVKAYKDAHPSHPVSFPVAPLLPNVHTLLMQEEPFAQGMQGIVNRFEQIADARVTTARVTEIALFGSTLIVLMLEACFIFAPAVRKLKHNTIALQTAEAKVASNAQTLQQRNSQLELALREVWAVRRKTLLSVQVVRPGEYRVLNFTGDHFYTVKAGPVGLACDCYVAGQTGVCSHIVAAAPAHAAMLRAQRSTTNIRPFPSRYA